MSNGVTTSSISSQLAFDSKKLKYCSTYNLAEGDHDPTLTLSSTRTLLHIFVPEGVDSKQQKGIYHLGSDLEVITPTQKRPVIR